MPSASSYFRITLTRSAIGLPKRSSGVLRALGLKKRMTTVFYPVTPMIAGQIMRVKELISVEEVDQPMSKQELQQSRRPDPGFWVEKRVPRFDETFKKPVIISKARAVAKEGAEV